MANEQDTKTHITKRFQTRIDELLPSNEAIPDPQLWMIKVNGEYVRLRSGKSSWKKIGHAKTALRNHFTGLSYYFGGGLDYKLANKVKEELYQAFLKDRCEFIDLLA